MSCGVGHRDSSDLVLLWLWCRLSAVALIGPLAWESPYTTGVALKKQNKTKQKKKEKEKGEAPLGSLLQHSKQPKKGAG